MPFTFSHPAVILPFTKVKPQWFSLTALFIGSMAPDFEYFLRMKMYGNYSHTLEGVFVFNLPLVIALSFLYHSIVRNHFIDNLPNALYNRLAPYKAFNWSKYFAKHFMVVILSAIVGVFSHIIWDSFTHGDGFFVERIWGLKGTFHLAGIKFKVYNVLQHISTVGGLFLVAYWVFKLPVTEAKSTASKQLYWGIVAVASVIVFVIRFVLGSEINSLKHLVVPIISALMTGVVIASLYKIALHSFSSRQKA